MSESFPELEEVLDHLCKLPREKLIPPVKMDDLEKLVHHKEISGILTDIKFWGSIND